MALVRIDYSDKIEVCPVCNIDCRVVIYCDSTTHKLSEKIECIACENKELEAEV